MTTSPPSGAAIEILVGMGQIAAGRAPQRMRAILGSCVGLALYHPGCKAGVLAHIVLPDAAGRGGTPGKFADAAVPHMLAALKQLGTPLHGLTAKLAGGANMFATTGPLKIGDANVKAVVKALQDAGIRIAGQDVGGSRGRRVDFDCASGEMIVQCAGQSPKTL
jgi:chemotaxis protein CheD